MPVVINGREAKMLKTQIMTTEITSLKGLVKIPTDTVQPPYSAFHGTGLNYDLYQGFHNCQHIDNNKITPRDQNLHALLVEICEKWVRYSGVSLYLRYSLKCTQESV